MAIPRNNSPLVVDVAAIPDEGLRFSLPLEGSWLVETLQGTDATAVAPGITAELELYHVLSQVDVRGKLTGALEVPCSRCVEPATLPLGLEFRMTYLPGPGAGLHGAGTKAGKASADELELAPDDLDVTTYTGTTIDLGMPLREQILLALPLSPLCQETCKGLCPSCGVNRNMEACACSSEPVHSRWDALRSVKLDPGPKS